MTLEWAMIYLGIIPKARKAKRDIRNGIKL